MREAVDPLVSILMLAYNGERYVRNAIESILAQTYANWELVIVDDCSGDGTWELVSEMAPTDHRIRAYRNEVNLGIVRNRKRAYSLSTGSLIGHVDNDDQLERYAIEEMVRAFTEFPEAMLIYSDMAQIGEYGEHQLYSAARNFDPKALHEHGWRHLGMYRRAVMAEVSGYNDQLVSACEDGDLFMQIAERFPVVRLPKPLYLYRAHPGNQSAANKKCSACTERPVCNYIRVWAKSAGYDPISFQPLRRQGSSLPSSVGKTIFRLPELS